jgi:glycosyltransferase involved in cell wall biosynthesis
MPRLLIDGTPVIKNPKGVGRYAYNLCLQLSKRLPGDWLLQILVDRENVSVFPETLRAELIPVEPVSELARAFLTIPKQVKRLNPQVLLKTNDSAGHVRGTPTVTVCHDIDDLILKAQGGNRGVFRSAVDSCKQYYRRQALQRSDFVVCNSEFTREAVWSRYNIPHSKTAVAYCAVDPRFHQISQTTDKAAVRGRYGVTNFILAFSTGDPRENSRCYPALAARMAALGINTCLLVAGLRKSEPYAIGLRTEFIRLGLSEGQHFILEDFLGEDRFRDLAELYTAADFYLELSLHEGFGMQLIEAMACGTTCVSSPRGALAEVGGGHVLLVNPTNVDEIAVTVKRAYENGLNLRDNREQIRYANTFSWERVGSTVTEILLQVAANKL